MGLPRFSYFWRGKASSSHGTPSRASFCVAWLSVALDSFYFISNEKSHQPGFGWADGPSFQGSSWASSFTSDQLFFSCPLQRWCFIRCVGPCLDLKTCKLQAQDAWRTPCFHGGEIDAPKWFGMVWSSVAFPCAGALKVPGNADRRQCRSLLQHIFLCFASGIC